MSKENENKDTEDFSKLIDDVFNNVPKILDNPPDVIEKEENEKESNVIPIKPKISVKSFNRTQIADIDMDEVNNFLDKDEKNKYLEIQKELFRNILFIDEQLQDIDIKTRNYDKFSKSIFESKIALVDQRLKHLEALSRINKESVNEKKELDSVKDITDLMGS